jgi:hypothetical protein
MSSALLAFDCVYYINLAHRTDRLAQIEEELRTLGWAGTRIEATHTPANGADGCLTSHCTALRAFLNTAGDGGIAPPRHALILEDDAKFDGTAAACVSQFLGDHPPAAWDVLMLAGNVRKVARYKKPYANKALAVYSTSAYAITRPFAARLLAMWEKRTLVRGKVPPCDVSWIALQPTARWYILAPTVALQRPSWSDIENRLTDYGV